MDDRLGAVDVQGRAGGGFQRASLGRLLARGFRSRRTATSALVLLSVLLLLAGWTLAARAVDPIILPSPADVWDAFVDQIERGVWWENVSETLAHAFLAFGLILAIGLPLGVVMGRLWFVESLLRVPLILLQMVPTVVLVAIMLIAVGTNSTGVVAVTTASGLTYFALNVIQGTRSVDHDLVEMGRAYGAGELAIMRSIVLPAVVPFFLAGSRVVLGVVWQVTLVAEYLMGTPSVGFAIANEIKLLDTASVFAWGLTIVALTIAFEYGVFRPLERALTRHTRRGG